MSYLGRACFAGVVPAIYLAFAQKFAAQIPLLDFQACTGHEEPYCLAFPGWEWHMTQHGGSNRLAEYGPSPFGSDNKARSAS